MVLHPACHAVENYLAAWFPESVIEEFEWASKQCWVFQVSVARATFQVLVSTQFLDKTDEHEIERLLQDWHVAHRVTGFMSPSAA